MYQFIKNLVKYNQVVLWFYRLFMGIFIRILSIFIKVDDKKIIFMAFGGKKFDDSPKVLYESMKNDPYFKDYVFVWGFVNPEQFDTGCKNVKTDTFSYFRELISSKIWISNSSLERGLHFKNKKHIELNTWHGTPFKKLGCDVENLKGYQNKNMSNADIFCAQSEFDQDIWVRIFNTERKNVILSDLPRNDVLATYSPENKKTIREKLNIPDDKFVILYAPTFREYKRDSQNACVMDIPITFDKWREELSDRFIVLVRIHYEAARANGFLYDDFFRDASGYENLSELIIASDALLSDYSSIYIDYSITEKPMFNFAYDIDEYEKNRGLYVNLADVLPCNINSSEDELIKEIKTFNYDNYCEKVKIFKNRFAPYAGNATGVVIEKLKDRINTAK